jgi:hypothetical protein
MIEGRCSCRGGCALLCYLSMWIPYGEVIDADGLLGPGLRVIGGIRGSL